ncbi:MAG: protein kinase [Blastocatellia bacterium]|nr:protein kinase [Blastocatellia bacterium]
MTGRLVQHYKITERLGAGGMGEVFRAEDTRLGRQVALKFLPASYQYDDDRRERFYREARAASVLRSPHIAAIYDIGEHDGVSFIVMELVEGDLLSRRITQGPLSVCDAIDIAMQIADALDEAHSLGIIHRDIKSSNLMITARGLVKVLDFGLAKVTPSGNLSPSAPEALDNSDAGPTVHLGQETAAGVVMGTVAYMSPEQALGRTVDHRSDLFSLGVVSYEMLAARLPFAGNSPTEIINQIVNQEPPAVARFNYDVPPEFERIVRKALEKQQDYRYQSARDMRVDLRNLRRDLEIAGVVKSQSQLQQDRQSTVALSDTSGLMTGSLEKAKIENGVAVMTFSNITKEPADDWIGSGIAETVTGDLKNVRGLSIIGRERIFEELKNIQTGALAEFDEKFAIDIGRRLGASWIIGGGYQRLGEMIRITARFVDVNTGALLKTVKIDGKVAEIFDLQDRIVYELSQGLNLDLGTSEINEIERDETESVEAYEHFSRGMINLRKGSRDSLDRAIYLFEKATELDPNYARAWSALGAVYDLKGSFLSIPELSHKAIEFERKAIELNPRLSQAHQWLGGSYATIGRYDEAIEAMKEAIRLDPDNAGGHSALARAYWIGKGMIDEGITELRHAISLNPQAGYAYLQLGLLYTLKGDYDRAETACKKAIELQERAVSGKEGLQVVGAHTRLGYVYYCQGRYDDAIREYKREMDFLASSDHALRSRTLIELNQKLGAAYLRSGKQKEAAHHFKEAIKRFEERVARGADDPFTKYYVACLYALKGDAERAIKYLEETLVELRALNTVRARIDPDFESLRDDPHFREIVGP